ncbi:MAG: response regulator [Nitrospira sp.]|nr:response regulator [Nitrospira sp.]
MSENACPIRVLVVDDHALMRKQILDLLRFHSDILVIGEAEDGEEALRQCAELAPAVIVMDINMPKLNGIEATRLIKKTYPKIIVIGLSVTTGRQIENLMKEAGSHAVFQKENAVEQLPKAIRQYAMT